MREAADSQTGFSTCFKAILPDHQSMESRIKDIINRLEVLAEAIDVLDLKGGSKKLP